MTEILFNPLFLIFGLCALLIVFLVAQFLKLLEATIEPRWKSSPDLHAAVIDPLRSSAAIFPGGREVFFRPPPYRPAVYQLIFSGVLRNSNGRLADAFYKTNDDGNFSEACNWLLVNNRRLSRSYEMVECDRYLHRYVIRLDHGDMLPGSRLTLAVDSDTRWSGSLSVELTVLPESTSLIATSRDREKMAREAARRTSFDAAYFNKEIQQLTVRAQLFANWDDPEFRNKFASVHYEELINNQSDIRAEAARLLQHHSLVQYLRRHEPVIIERLLGRLETLQIAERVALDKRLAAEAPLPLIPPPAPPPRKRLTAGEVRAIKIRKQEVQIGDKVALKLNKVKAKLKVRDDLATMPFSDDDERDAVEEQLFREIDEGDDDNENTQTL